MKKILIISLLSLLIFSCSDFKNNQVKESITENTETLHRVSIDMEMPTTHIMRDIESDEENSMVWITDWKPSDNGQSAYGKGRFFYRLARSPYKGDYGDYKYEIYFISDSYYNAGMYNSTPYRSATKIDEVKLFVNGQPYINESTGSHTFWIMFQGNYDQGSGEMRVSFHYPSHDAQVYITWSTPIPF